MSDFSKLEPEVIVEKIRGNPELMGAIRVVACNMLMSVMRDAVEPVVLAHMISATMKGQMDNERSMRGVLAGFVKLLEHYPAFGVLFDELAKVPKGQNTVDKVRAETVKRGDVNQRAAEFFEKMGAKVHEIPGVGMVVDIDITQEDPFREILDALFGGSNTRKPH